MTLVQRFGTLLVSLLIPLSVSGMLPSDAGITGTLQRTSVPVTICLDAGHGGDNVGADIPYDNTVILEKDLDLKICLYLADELKAYPGVTVVLTRTEDRNVGIEERVGIATANHADYLISLHNNRAHDPTDQTIHGCMVLLPVGHYQVPDAVNPDIYGTCTVLGEAVIRQLNGLGIPYSTDFNVHLTGGLLRRPYSTSWDAGKDVFYPDGSPADYYGLIRNGVEAGIPTILIEHVYLSNEDDYRRFLATDEGLKTIAAADAAGIAEALGLKK